MGHVPFPPGSDVDRKPECLKLIMSPLSLLAPLYVSPFSLLAPLYVHMYELGHQDEFVVPTQYVGRGLCICVSAGANVCICLYLCPPAKPGAGANVCQS